MGRHHMNENHHSGESVVGWIVTVEGTSVDDAQPAKYAMRFRQGVLNTTVSLGLVDSPTLPMDGLDG